MGTRGFIVLICNTKIIVVYNHFDSYPDGLGSIVIRDLNNLLKQYSMDQLKELIDKLKIVSDSVPPTESEKELLSKYANLTVNKRTLDDWYCLLHKCQGSLIKILESEYADSPILSIEELDDYIKNSWVNYTYTLNFDTNEFFCNKYYIDKLDNLQDDWCDSHKWCDSDSDESNNDEN